MIFYSQNENKIAHKNDYEDEAFMIKILNFTY